MDEALRPEAPTLATDLESDYEIDPVIEQQEAEERNLAALVDHPGWLPFRTILMDKIAAYRTLKGVDIVDKTNEQIGELFKVSSSVADELESALVIVDETAKQIDSQPNARKVKRAKK